MTRAVRRIPRKMFESKQVDGMLCLVHRPSGRPVLWSPTQHRVLFNQYWAEVEESVK